MAESPSHKEAKKKAAGRGGQTEVPLPGGKRLDALTRKGTPVEIERSGNRAGIEKAVKRLEQARGKARPELHVPQNDMPLAESVIKQAAERPITLSNLGGTQTRVVKPE